MTTSYTSAFWSWEDWELQLDWMALRGINLPLAWVGVEKIFIEVFREIGLTNPEIEGFLSGPAFLAWNHFGNIQGSWGGDLPFAWAEDQFALQMKILQRMIDLGMTPILPAFPGFVPPAISRLYPDAKVSNGSVWEDFPTAYTSDTFLDPLDNLFKQLQLSFIAKQNAHYGNITKFYTLDQFNENNPASGDETYLKSVSSNTWKSLKAADPNAVWVMQGWLFSSNSAFWTNSRIEAFLGGVAVDSDMLILDLFSESSPQWQRTNSYYGKPWIWCELHNYGGNMGLYGQIMNITVDAIAALQNTSSNLVGFGLSMEGQEGNEIVYDLLLDQAWSETAIDTKSYFHDWVAVRYGATHGSIPDCLYAAWELVRPTVYNNTNLTANAVPKAVYELMPSTSGLVNRTGHHPTLLNYDPSVLVEAWNLMYRAGLDEPSLFVNAAYQYDLVDWTRQVFANAFTPLYESLVEMYTTSNQTESSKCQLQTRAREIFSLLTALDAVLSTNANFRLSTWITAARATTNSSETVADFLEYEARNQITLWGPTGQINDYASKSWGGLVSTYYLPRWQMFVEYLLATPASSYNQTAFEEELLVWEVTWANQTTGGSEAENSKEDLRTVLEPMVGRWSSIFAS